MRLTLCGRCGAHRVGEACPSCGASVPLLGASFAAVFLGLALAGCPDTEEATPARLPAAVPVPATPPPPTPPVEEIQALYGAAVQDAPAPELQKAAIAAPTQQVQALYGVPVHDPPPVLAVPPPATPPPTDPPKR